MEKVKAVVFDADGTLFNSYELIVEAYKHVAKTHNFPEPSLDSLKGHLRLATPLHEILEKSFPGANVSELLETNNAFFAENALRIEGYEGMHDMLAELHALDIKIAILTGGSHKVHNILKVHNIDNYFSSVVHSERVRLHKPHPEGYLLALKECGNIQASTSIMIGDSPSDIGAGKGAGALATIGLTHGNASRYDLEQAGADYIVDSLEEAKEIVVRIINEN